MTEPMVHSKEEFADIQKKMQAGVDFNQWLDYFKIALDGSANIEQEPSVTDAAYGFDVVERASAIAVAAVSMVRSRNPISLEKA
jgi:hypothetical protein